MKKLIILAIAALFAFSACMQAPGLIIDKAVTVKVGETVQLHPGTEGEGLKIEDIKKIAEPDYDKYVIYDQYWRVTGVAPGKTRVGIAILKDPTKETSETLYEAWCEVTVVE